MLSIIICSSKQSLTNYFYNNIVETVGVEFELVVVDNSMNKYSIFEAYNLGIQKSSYQYLCFVHDDVIFRTQNWGKNVITHLSNDCTGFIGIAGGPIMPVVPASWIGTYSVFNLLQSDKTGKKKTKKRVKPIGFAGLKQKAVVLDGVFLCARKDIFDKISFDNNFNGFHCYDLDICIQSFLKGFTNFVVYDILIEHFSRGSRNKSYYNNLLYLYNKWEAVLPLVIDERKDFYRRYQIKIEFKKLRDLVSELLINKFDCNEVLKISQVFANKINPSRSPFLLRTIKLIIVLKCFVRKRSSQLFSNLQ